MLNSNSPELLSNIITHYLANENVAHQSLSFILDVIISHRLLNDNLDTSEDVANMYRKWTVRLNALLQSKNVTARWCAICLIRVSCENSHYLLINNAKAWAAQLLGLLAKAEPVMIHRESIETLSFMFEYTAEKPELQREVATPNMQRYNQLLLQLARKQELLPTVLSALTSNVKHFPANARHISDQCLQLCLSCLDGNKDLDEATLSKVNECLASLYNAGGKSVMAEQWKDSISRLVGSVHDCLNRLFDTIDEETQDTQLPESYPFSAVPKDYITAFPVLMKRVQLLQNCISTFLTLPTSIPVGVPITQLVDLICRIYSVYEGSLSLTVCLLQQMREFKDKSEFFTLNMCLPSIHLSTSKLFASLLYCSGQDMVRYSKLFSRILHRLLSEYKHKRALKISIYRLVSLCLEKCGYAFAENIHKPLITAILDDLSIVQHKVTGITFNTNQQKKSHKKRRTEVTNSDALSTSTKLMSAASTDVQIAALEALASLYDIYGFSMENGSRASIDGTVLNRLIQLIQPFNMTTEECMLVKAELYNCLLKSVMHPIETQASILPHASRLFASGLNESSHYLQTICKKGLAMCDLVMHARLPPVQRPVPKSAPPTVVVTTQEVGTEVDVERSSDVTSSRREKSMDDVELVVEEKMARPTEEVKNVTEDKPTLKLKPVVVIPVPSGQENVGEPIATTKENQTKKQLDQIVSITHTTDISVEKEAFENETVDKEIEKPTEVENVSVVLEHKNVEEDTKVENPLSLSAVIDNDMDMDLDMEMPVIDMTDPDTDEDDE
ncbi:rRNA processing/ribosome biogenesis-domain-containing protein [Mycotypha africana]|uniref:rRNA processing/ribosome biogenesis-domain-containing protein n=1 Tax=Mycotypha africana TaxID=64632 RepID=UPI002301E36F|nr:rRNA processing/ribosome biogenesis-domain-containing protein [Mycotypha africana]KAI8981697.1 rRNA processing/ribosome biogenesis-domain-containing protein [Mycotypha africana]